MKSDICLMINIVFSMLLYLGTMLTIVIMGFRILLFPAGIFILFLGIIWVILGIKIWYEILRS